MTAQIKRKTSVKKEAPAAKHYRLRLREWMMFWILVAFTMILIVTIFEDVNLKIEALDISSPNDQILQTEITALKNELAEAQVKLNKGTDSGMLATSALSPCLSMDPTKIDNYLSYTNEEQTIKLMIPYSTGWKNPDCTPLAPANVQSGSLINFGPYVTGTEELYRDSSLVVLPKMTLEQLKQQISQEKTGEEAQNNNIRQRTINGLTVYSYTTDYIIGSKVTTWFALGRNYTYRLKSINWLTDAEAVKIIQSLRVTK